MARLCGASCGLLLFSAMIFCGILAGNPAEVIVLRAVGGLFGGLFLGMLAGCIGVLIVRDNVKSSLEDEAEEAEAFTETTAGDEPTSSPQAGAGARAA